jgi:ribosomal protein L17
MDEKTKQVKNIFENLITGVKNQETAQREIWQNYLPTTKGIKNNLNESELLVRVREAMIMAALVSKSTVHEDSFYLKKIDEESLIKEIFKFGNLNLLFKSDNYINLYNKNTFIEINVRNSNYLMVVVAYQFNVIEQLKMSLS